MYVYIYTCTHTVYSCGMYQACTLCMCMYMYNMYMYIHAQCTCLIRTCTLEECMYVRAGAERGRKGLGLVIVCWGETQEGGQN